MTYATKQCPGCASDASTVWPALVSPFVASYALGARPAPTRLRECTRCGLRFFEDRLTSDEAGRLYGGYRGDRYFAARRRAEPWYSRRLNDGIGASDEQIRVRHTLVERFLRARVDVDAIGDVLDFGGDRGQLIPPTIGKQRFVYEISGVTPVPGVTGIASAEDLAGRRFDLILLSHVLEHCSEPRDVLAEVRPLLRSKESLLYVELPLERTDLRFVGRSGWYRRYLDVLRRTGPVLTAVDLYSTAFRVRFGVLPPLGFMKLHEHVNFFDVRSLRAMLEASGLVPVVAEELAIASSLGVTPVISALARLA